jgi:phage recombination protein Bet
MNALTKNETGSLPALQMTEAELISVLQSSLYPGAQLPSIKMVIDYCRASQLDPMQKPVHIVPMSVKVAGTRDKYEWRDVIMPGIGLYRTQAARSHAYGGITEPEFGPEVEKEVGGVTVAYPQWCKVTVKRRLPDGMLAEFTAVERWLENYATAGRDSRAPNSMWKKRPYGQLAKCAQAQALRMAFPEIGAMPTAEEMEGKQWDESQTIDATDPTYRIPTPTTKPKAKSTEGATTVEPKQTTQEPAAEAKPVNAGQLKWVQQKCGSLGLDVDAVLAELSIESLDTLTPEQFVTVKTHLMAQ